MFNMRKIAESCESVLNNDKVRKNVEIFCEKCAKCWESMRECTKCRESMLKAEESVLKV